MKSHLRIVTVPTSDTSERPCLLLTYDDKKYLFNCGEGTQRQLLVQKIGLRKIKEVFLSTGWDSAGGLPGLLLSSTGFKGPPIGIHGPRNTAYLLASLRYSLLRRGEHTVPVSIHEYNDALPEPFVDKHLIVQPILTRPELSSPSDSPPSSPNRSWPRKRRKFELSPRVENAIVLEEERSAERTKNIAEATFSGAFLEKLGGKWVRSEDDHSKSNEAATVKVDGEVKADTPSDEDREVKRAFHRYMHHKLPTKVSPSSAAVSYLIRAHPAPGRFNPKAAAALGVAAGPDFGKLQRGETVVSSTGAVVTPDEVMGKKRETVPVVILDCPHTSHISSLVSSTVWQTQLAKDQVVLMIHAAGDQVLRDPRYIGWLRSFGPGVKHIVSNAKFVRDDTTNDRAEFQAQNLGVTSRQIFLEPYRDPAIAEELYLQDLRASALDIVSAEPGLDVVTFPDFKVSNVAIDVMSLMTASKGGLEDLSRYHEAAEAARETVASLESEASKDIFPGRDIEVTTLGTGSASPSSYRNVSSTIVRTPDGLSFVLDCGEGTLGQLRRAFGHKYLAVLREINLVIISHLHADHHLGFTGFLKAWMSNNRYNDNVLFVVCPLRYSSSLEEYALIDDIGIHRIAFIDAAIIKTPPSGQPDERAQTELRRIKALIPGIESIETVEAIHASQAYSFRINHESGWSICYSGDTRPNPNFVRLGLGATLLIHEATFEEHLLEEAIAKRHSTVAEAISTAEQMGVHCTLLTHFSQRYPKLPKLESDNGFSQKRLGVCFDLMQVRLGDIWKLNHFLKPITVLYEELERLKIEGKLKEDENEEEKQGDDMTFTVHN